MLGGVLSAGTDTGKTGNKTKTDHLESEGTRIRFVSGDPNILKVLQSLNVFGMVEPLHRDLGVVGEGGKPELRDLLELAPAFLIVWNEFSVLIKLDLELDAEVILLESLELRELLWADGGFGT
jgi:hypothetical protein